MPLHHHVSHLTPTPLLGAGKPGGRQRRQPDQGEEQGQALGPRGAGSHARGQIASIERAGVPVPPLGSTSSRFQPLRELGFAGRIKMSMKTFTLEEAESLLSILESLLRTSIEGKKKIESLEAAFQELKSRIFLAGGMSINLENAPRQRALYDKTVQQVRDAVAEIHSIGVQVKDLDIGLLDFPCQVDNEIVLLCWKYGAQGIT